MLSKIALFFLGMLFSGSAFSQEKLNAEAITSDWSLFHEAKGIKFYIKKDVFSSPGRLDMDYALIKLENTSDKTLDVSYKPVIYYSTGCANCSSDEYFRTVTVPAHGSIEGNLEDGKLPIVILLTNPNLKNSLVPQAVGIQNLTIN